MTKTIFENKRNINENSKYNKKDHSPSIEILLILGTNSKRKQVDSHSHYHYFVENLNFVQFS
jgi:hypothetical protein